MIWTSGTAGWGNLVMALMQGWDGNFVLYDRRFSPPLPLWATNTDGNPGAFFAPASDGNLIVYGSNGAVLWASNTCCR
jgi:hypothetical protein